MTRVDHKGGGRSTALEAPRGMSRWWLDRSIRIKGLTVVAIPMMALIAVTSASVVLSQEERSERRVAIAANTLTNASEAVLNDALDAETGVRGYSGTGDTLLLEPYLAAVRRKEPDLRTLRSAAAGYGGAEATPIVATTEQVFGQLAALRTAVATGASIPTQVGLLEAQKLVMDRLRSEIAAFTSGPSASLAQARASIAQLESVILLVEIGGLLLGLGAGVAGVALFTSGIGRRVRTAAANADRIGQGEALAPAHHAADELGRLGESLTQAQHLMEQRQRQLTAARDQALQASQTKNTFLSRTSHELRTPLNAVMGFAQLLEMSDLSPNDRDCAVRILGAGRHLLALINELIDIARIESGEMSLSVEPVRLRSVTQEVATLIRPLAEARGIDLRVRGDDPTLAGYADAQRLRQVLVNLASNAVKYNREDGALTIDYEAGGENQVTIAVTDTGPGLAPEQVQQIFVPFERLEAEQQGIEGTGIGLPLALALTEAMHGSLDVASHPGSGSTFTVRLPRASDVAAPDAPAPALARSRIPTSNLVVLSIEDNDANNELLVRLFGTWPESTLHVASNGQSGIDLALRHRPDLVLLDLHLPDLTGEEVFARLRAEPTTKDIPVVVLSADATPSTVKRLLARGAEGYLTKPLDLGELQDILTRLSRGIP